jgi:hypothetical protein
MKRKEQHMFKLQFDTDNEIFSTNPGAEIERILHDVASKAHTVAFPGGNHSGRIFDENGNGVGSWSLTLAKGEAN